MAAFGSALDDREAFETRWRGMLDNEGSLIRTIEVEAQTAGYVAHFQQFDRPSISYWLGRSFWGRGIAKTAVAQFVAGIAARPLYARVAWDNQASLRVLAHCGFQRVGTDRDFAQARGEDLDEIILALTGPDPAAGSPS